jgi:Amt family ammonium transporter
MNIKYWRNPAGLLSLLLLKTSSVLAQDGAAASALNSGDIAWMIVSTALVLFMTPGLALFYGGMVRRKNVIATIMQSMIAIPVLSVLWLVIGYSLAFSPTPLNLPLKPGALVNFQAR